MTPFQEHITKNQKRLTLDTFGDIVDEFITKNDCKMLIEFPAGESSPKISDNVGIGPVGSLYFCLKAITPTFRDLCKGLDLDLDDSQREQLADAICSLIKAELLEA